jgi:cation diffusion facilitator family transporter
MAILSDAVHSLPDVANNTIAWIVVRISTRPADESHPYGHQKFETIAVFGLAMLLTVLAFELALRALQRSEPDVVQTGWALGIMIGVLVVNASLAAWQGRWARRLESDILAADARHTFADVLTTVVVIAGWQAAARGYLWFDTAAALGVSGVILVLAYGLFKRAIPILVDESALEPDALTEVALAVPGVEAVRSVRSRGYGSRAAVEIVAVVAPDLSTVESHDIASAIEHAIRSKLPAESVLVHVEPEAAR